MINIRSKCSGKVRVLTFVCALIVLIGVLMVPLSAATGVDSPYFYNEGSFDLTCDDGQTNYFLPMHSISSNFPYDASNPLIVRYTFDRFSVSGKGRVLLDFFAKADGSSAGLYFTSFGMVNVYSYASGESQTIYRSYVAEDLGDLMTLEFCYYKVPSAYTSLGIYDEYFCTIEAVFSKTDLSAGVQLFTYTWTLPFQNEVFFPRVYTEGVDVSGSYEVGDLVSMRDDAAYEAGKAAGRVECGETHKALTDAAYSRGMQDCTNSHGILREESYKFGYNAGYEDGVIEGGLNTSDELYLVLYNRALEMLGRSPVQDLPASINSPAALYKFVYDACFTTVADQGTLTQRLIYTALEAPINVALGSLNFELFGFNLAEILFGILSVILVFFIIKTVLDVVGIVL